MAKSLRSKWRRKMKAEKRVRYGEKELQRLKDMLTKAGDYQMIGDGKGDSASPIDEAEKIPINSLPRPQRKRSRHRAGNNNTDEPEQSTRKSRLDEFEDVEMGGGGEDDDGGETKTPDEAMSVDKPDRVFSKRSMKDQFGNYPAWMNKRKINTQKKKNKRIAKRRALSVAGKRVRK